MALKLHRFVESIFTLIFLGFLHAVPMNGVNSSASHFELLCDLGVPGSVPIQKYRSRKTGLHVIIAKIDGPIVNGYFTLATEAQDNDGLPHCLEHLVFLGSEEYPYKGVLDLLANRCLATGTNAWTDVDHTAFTIETAGEAGFLNLLPIYLDHLLYPTLTDSGYTTEVYHITGEGDDAGVVYSEMQARENTANDLTYAALQEELYPEPCGYRYETGGRMENLRNSITNQKIRGFHKKFYRPENLHIIVVGHVEAADIFSALRHIEDKILNKGPLGNFTRPWQSPVPPITQTLTRDVTYPSDIEGNGMVRIAWRGPSSVSQIEELEAVQVLMNYLTDSSISPIPQAFEEVQDPLASSVFQYALENSVTGLTFKFEGVPRERINEVDPLMMQILHDIKNRVIPFDIKMMRDILTNLIMKEDSKMESHPHYTVANYVINDAVYGNTCKDLQTRLSRRTIYAHLSNEDEIFWLRLLEKYFLNAPRVVIRGIPSVDRKEELQNEFQLRRQKRNETFGELGLQALAKKVRHAEEENNIPPPDWLLEIVPVPPVETVRFHSLTTYSNINNGTHDSLVSRLPPKELLDFTAIPVKMQVDDIHSNFIQIIAVLDASSLPANHLPYIQLLLSLLLESPVSKEGKIVPYEEVVRNINKNTLKAEAINGLGLWGMSFTVEEYFSNVVINLKVEMGKYEKAVELLQDVLFNVVFDEERMRVKTLKLLNSIGDLKRSGNTIVSLMLNEAVFEKDTAINQGSILRQERFLNSLKRLLQTNPKQAVKNMEAVYRKITGQDQITVHLATDLKKLALLSNVTTPWVDFGPFKMAASLEDLSLNVIPDYLQKRKKLPQYTGFMTGMGSVESAYLLQAAPSIDSYTHADLPALMTAISYLTQLEGPMWKQIRGKGLAYHYRISVLPVEGTVNLRLTKASQLTAAYREALSILGSHLNGTTPWRPVLFESAKSSLIYEIIDREAQVADVVQQSLLAYYRKVPSTYNRDLLLKISDVELEEMIAAAEKYLAPLMDPSRSQTVIVLPPSEVEHVLKEMKRFGHRLQVIDSLEDSHYARF